jgi:hypothetical protein
MVKKKYMKTTIWYLLVILDQLNDSSAVFMDDRHIV